MEIEIDRRIHARIIGSGGSKLQQNYERLRS